MPAKKPAPAKKAAAPAKKPAAKAAAKPAPAKKAAAPAKKPAAKPAPKKETVDYRNYHINKRKEDGKWTVKFAGGEKVIKLFDTQKEALEYTKKMAANQGGSVLVHASKGAQKGKIKKK